MSDQPKFEDLPLPEQLDKWAEAERFARRWAAIELTMRNYLFTSNFKDPKRGVNKIKTDKYEDGEQMALVLNYKLNLSLSDKAGWLTAVKDKVISTDLADKVVSWSPKVKDAAYSSLGEDDLKLVAPFVTEKPATPSLEVKPVSTLRW